MVVVLSKIDSSMQLKMAVTAVHKLCWNAVDVHLKINGDVHEAVSSRHEAENVSNINLHKNTLTA